MNGDAPITRIEQFNQAVRGIVTLSFVAAFIFMAISKFDIPEAMMIIVTNVITFWFAREQKTTSAKSPTDGPSAPPTTPRETTP